MNKIKSKSTCCENLGCHTYISPRNASNMMPRLSFDADHRPGRNVDILPWKPICPAKAVFGNRRSMKGGEEPSGIRQEPISKAMASGCSLGASQAIACRFRSISQIIGRLNRRFPHARQMPAGETFLRLSRRPGPSQKSGTDDDRSRLPDSRRGSARSGPFPSRHQAQSL